MILKGKQFEAASLELMLRETQLQSQARKGQVSPERAEKFGNLKSQFERTGDLEVAKKAMQVGGMQKSLV